MPYTVTLHALRSALRARGDDYAVPLLDAVESRAYDPVPYHTEYAAVLERWLKQGSTLRLRDELVAPFENDPRVVALQPNGKPCSWVNLWTPLDTARSNLATFGSPFHESDERYVRPLAFHELRDANDARNAREWGGHDKYDVEFRAIEAAGEAGEAMNAVKKYLRGQRKIAGSTLTLTAVAEELADVVISFDLLAMQLGIDLAVAIREKFNATSDKHGMRTKL